MLHCTASMYVYCTAANMIAWLDALSEHFYSLVKTACGQSIGGRIVIQCTCILEMGLEVSLDLQ